jgi:integrase
MDRTKRAELKRQIAALEAQLPDGVYEDLHTGTWYVKFRLRGKSNSRRVDPAGNTLLTREHAVAARGEWLALLDKGQVTSGKRRRFDSYWAEYLNHARGEMTHGSWVNLGGDGRKRLLPFFGEYPLARIDVALVREWRAEMVEAVENGDLSAKTVNNTRVALLGCLKMAMNDGLIAGNPVLNVKPLPVKRTEPKYLKVKQIPVYLDAAPAYYRPLAEFLIGTGARVSEAIAIRPDDVDLEAGTVAIMRQRTRRSGLATEQTKGKNFRTVEVGSRLKAMLADLVALRAEHGREWLFEAPTPKRGPHSHRTEPLPPARRTVLEWHEATLEDAGLKDMPLHGLRHTAAAAWLGTGHSLQFVKDQLGHSTIEVTSEYYAHLDSQFRSMAAQMTEDLIFGAHDDGS